ncbi:MAG: L-seryl-tRNA(Sec) selenium transferase, partial [bacterium]
ASFGRPSLQRAINGTGIILHTGLGRAPLSTDAKENLLQVAEGYCNLELDLQTGKRGNRNSHVEELLCHLTGAEAACVVNNNAAAVLLALNTLCFGKEAIVSRGQLIEIGGSFRIPEVMEKSGAVMVEVGTTNKTHLKDYEKAICGQTGLLCLVHPSNFRVQGFTAEVSHADVVKLAARYDIPVLQDLGGGILVDLRDFGLPYEPVVQESVKSGLDVITFSGDKVLGGPQSGILVGKKTYIDEIKRNPLMRALRCDKLIYAALEATLRLFLQRGELASRNLVFKLLLMSVDELQKRAETLKKKLSEAVKNTTIAIEDTRVEIGSGALPLEELPSKAISLRSRTIPTEILAQKFRTHTPPVIGYIREDRLFFDLRTVLANEDEVLLASCQKILA